MVRGGGLDSVNSLQVSDESSYESHYETWDFIQGSEYLEYLSHYEDLKRILFCEVISGTKAPLGQFSRCVCNLSLKCVQYRTREHLLHYIVCSSCRDR
jgi:hypothetical protein